MFQYRLPIAPKRARRKSEKFSRSPSTSPFAADCVASPLGLQFAGPADGRPIGNIAYRLVFFRAGRARRRSKTFQLSNALLPWLILDVWNE